MQTLLECPTSPPSDHHIISQETTCRASRSGRLALALVVSIQGQSSLPVLHSPMEETSAHVLLSTAASVIIVPGVSAGALKQQTCCHFEELMENWCGAPHVWIYDHGVQFHTEQPWDTFCQCGGDLVSEMLNLIEQQPQVS
jgi:hypothetical protein